MLLQVRFFAPYSTQSSTHTEPIVTYDNAIVLRFEALSPFLSGIPQEYMYIC